MSETIPKQLKPYLMIMLETIPKQLKPYLMLKRDDSVEGKVLHLKQQYTLCSASLQDIIACFERRSGANANWEDVPEKVAVQMNDTHPTLCIPELMRILIDLKRLRWKEIWNIMQTAEVLPHPQPAISYTFGIFPQQLQQTCNSSQQQWVLQPRIPPTRTMYL